MPKESFQKIARYIILTIVCALTGASLLFSQEPDYTAQADNKGYIVSGSAPELKKTAPDSKEKIAALKKRADSSKIDRSLTELQRQARFYRDEGLKAQKIGNVNSALAFYQKAIQLDPHFAVVYNDLGVLYEGYGETERAENSYLEAIKVDPNYLSSYTNLALIYEDRRDIDKAAACWKKRWELDPVQDDPWALKAHQRYDDIMAVKQGKSFVVNIREQEVLGLTKDVIKQKDLYRKDSGALAKAHFQKAKECFKKQDEVTALKEAIDAQQLDPGNKDIEAFIDKVQHRLLSK